MEESKEFDIADLGESLPSLESILQEDDSSVYQFEEIDAGLQHVNPELKLVDNDGNISLASVALPSARSNINLSLIHI